MTVGEPDGRAARLVVDADDLADDDRDVAEHRPQRHDHGARVDRARGDLRQERLVLHEVLGVHDRDVVAGLREPVHVHRRVQPGEPAADDQDPLGCP